MIYLTNRSLLEQIALSKLSYCEFTDPKYSRYDEIVLNMDDVVEPEVVYRVMTYEHIPLDDNRATRSRAVGGQGHARVNFPPFVHAIWDGDKVKVVGRSHYHDGKFCLSKGRINRTLAAQLLLLVSRYGEKSNWRGYGYREELEGLAILQLMQNALQFNEAKGDNPFAFLTQCIKNSFRRQLAIELKQADVQDEIRIAAGVMPSHRWFNNQEKLQQEGK